MISLVMQSSLEAYEIRNLFASNQFSEFCHFFSQGYWLSSSVDQDTRFSLKALKSDIRAPLHKVYNTYSKMIAKW
jgi:hypothetical protein